ncbi:hypothetical protein QE152_g22106 [Popillia japonica]|uniref:Uncharacterized protein n=1 Tax=Popillia japonica TaxID=7064 RepID=A0AAW1KL45_POPJA
MPLIGAWSGDNLFSLRNGETGSRWEGDGKRAGGGGGRKAPSSAKETSKPVIAQSSMIYVCITGSSFRDMTRRGRRI